MLIFFLIAANELLAQGTFCLSNFWNWFFSIWISVNTTRWCFVLQFCVRSNCRDTARVVCPAICTTAQWGEINFEGAFLLLCSCEIKDFSCSFYILKTKLQNGNVSGLKFFQQAPIIYKVKSRLLPLRSIFDLWTKLYFTLNMKTEFKICLCSMTISWK